MTTTTVATVMAVMATVTITVMEATTTTTTAVTVTAVAEDGYGSPAVRDARRRAAYSSASPSPLARPAS